MPLPIDFITRTRTLLGEEFDRFAEALGTDAPVSIRINPAKGTPAPKAGTPVGWSELGFYLPERLTFTFDPLFHAGAYYVQEASSMFLEQVVRTYIHEPIRCLDLCAAPGGKSTHLASLLPSGSLLVCNEVIRSRSYVLAENIAKWGIPGTAVINNDPEEIGKALPHLFDLIVADVPCSGEGMFRKDTDSTGEWSVENVRLCASRGRRIIHDIWNALKPGGILVYSTCTYNTEEDEENVHYFVEELGAEPLTVPTRPGWQVSGALRFDHPVYRFFPHKTRGEGFFLAALRKPEGEIEEIRLKASRKKEKGKAAPAIPGEARQYLTEGSAYSWAWRENNLYAFPKKHEDLFNLLSERRLRVLSAGIRIGESKGKDLIPAQELALSVALNPEAFPTTELSWEEAIRFLRKEVIALPAGMERGYALVRYGGIPLGFVKNVGNRANNLYPQEWRIRSGFLPEQARLFQ